MEKTVQYFFDIIDIMADIFVLNTFPSMLKVGLIWDQAELTQADLIQGQVDPHSFQV